MHSLSTNLHTAVLDVMTGAGVLVVPDPARDVADPFDGSSANLADMLALLDRLGPTWTLPEDDFGSAILVGRMPDGREVLALGCAESVIGLPTLTEVGEVEAAMLATLGAVRCESWECSELRFAHEVAGATPVWDAPWPPG
ncbi:MAG TPA: hypothetical protein PLX71_08775 [Phycicoccus sp.]|nr:hypothetical protein [Phycicoccus sp.]